MTRSGGQYKLFETEARFKNGFRYRPDFITEDEEELLLSFIEAQDLKRVTAGENDEYVGRRHYKNFGWSFRRGKLVPGPELPRFLQRFAHRIEKWLSLPRGRVVEALINEYPAGTGVGWHKDNEPFEHIVGISLKGWARMRLRPIRRPFSAKATKGRRAADIEALEVEPRSAYVMQGDVRDNWQHSIAPTKTLRFSITFRTLPKGTPTPKKKWVRR